MRPSPAMVKWFGRANALGQISFKGPRGFAQASWDRCMKRAQAMGFVTPNAYGEFELTEAGRAHLPKKENANGT